MPGGRRVRLFFGGGGGVGGCPLALPMTRSATQPSAGTHHLCPWTRVQVVVVDAAAARACSSKIMEDHNIVAGTQGGAAGRGWVALSRATEGAGRRHVSRDVHDLLLTRSPRSSLSLPPL